VFAGFVVAWTPLKRLNGSHPSPRTIGHDLWRVPNSACHTKFNVQQLTTRASRFHQSISQSCTTHISTTTFYESPKSLPWSFRCPSVVPEARHQPLSFVTYHFWPCNWKLTIRLSFHSAMREDLNAEIAWRANATVKATTRSFSHKDRTHFILRHQLPIQAILTWPHRSTTSNGGTLRIPSVLPLQVPIQRSCPAHLETTPTTRTHVKTNKCYLTSINHIIWKLIHKLVSLHILLLDVVSLSMPQLLVFTNAELVQ